MTVNWPFRVIEKKKKDGLISPEVSEPHFQAI